VLLDVLLNALSDELRGRQIAVVQESDKLVTTVSKQNIRHSQASPGVPHDMAQDIVSNLSSMLSIDVFEAYHVDENKRQF